MAELEPPSGSNLCGFANARRGELALRGGAEAARAEGEQPLVPVRVLQLAEAEPVVPPLLVGPRRVACHDVYDDAGAVACVVDRKLVAVVVAAVRRGLEGREGLGRGARA